MMNKSKFGFTLAEVLITLGIIGIVAAMTIPTLMNTFREKVIVNQLKRTYSVLSQAYKLSVAENGEIEGWDIGPHADSMVSSLKLYLMFKPYMKISEDCGEKAGCFSKNQYKALDGKTNWAWDPYRYGVYARCRLIEGSSLAFWSTGKCDKNGICGAILVDINGNNSPNQAGVDFFRFHITTNGIVPLSPNNTPTGYGGHHICKYNYKSSLNGASCTKWVLEKGNLDYLRRDVSAQMSKL